MILEITGRDEERNGNLERNALRKETKKEKKEKKGVGGNVNYLVFRNDTWQHDKD